MTDSPIPVIVETDPAPVVIQVEVPAEIEIVEVLVEGQQGPPGPPGPSGSGEPEIYTISGVASFTAAHGRSYPPASWLLTPSGEMVEADILHSPGSLTVVFAQPFTGTLFVR